MVNVPPIIIGFRIVVVPANPLLNIKLLRFNEGIFVDEIDEFELVYSIVLAFPMVRAPVMA